MTSPGFTKAAIVSSTQVICAFHPLPDKLSPLVLKLNVIQPEALIVGSQLEASHPPFIWNTPAPPAVSIASKVSVPSYTKRESPVDKLNSEKVNNSLSP